MTGYFSKSIIDGALVDSQRTWAFRYEVIAPDGSVKGPAEVIQASVENDDLADHSKRTGNFVISRDTDMNYSLDRLRCTVSLFIKRYDENLLIWEEDWQDFPVGTFHLSSDSRRWNSRVSDHISAQGYDGLIVLAQDAVLDRYVVQAGQSYVGTIKNILLGAGFSDYNITDSATTLPAAKEWEPGTPKLSIINNLLSALNYRSLYMDPYGVPTGEPYVDPDLAKVVWNYTVDKKSVIIPNIDVSLDLFNVPNAWIAVISEPDRTALSSTYVNNSPTSTLSTVNRGRTVVEVLGNVFDNSEEGGIEAATQAILDAKVQQRAKEASQQFQIAEFSTGIMPFHGTGDVCIIDYGEGQHRYRSHTWAMDLKVGGLMKHRFRRVVVL